MIDADLLVTNIRELLTCRGPAPLVGPRQRDVTSQSNAALAVKNGRLVFVGTARDAAASVKSAITSDAFRQHSVVP